MLFLKKELNCQLEKIIIASCIKLCFFLLFLGLEQVSVEAVGTREEQQGGS
jgi:hypothetical protein